METLNIKEVAEQTGLQAGTIRQWEQRYGFPAPRRSDSGYRKYTPEDVETLRRVVAYRHRGLSVPAAIERAVEAGGGSDHASIYAAVASTDHGARPQVLRKSTLIALSRAIEHEALAQAASPLLFGAFQQERFFRAVEHRWRKLTAFADASAVFADFPAVARPRGGPVELPIDPDDKLGNEWCVIVDAPGYAACLLAWEIPGEAGGSDDRSRRFEAIWTIDPRATRRAAQVAAQLAGRVDPALGERIGTLLSERPLAYDSPSPMLTALTNRAINYIEASTL